MAATKAGILQLFDVFTYTVKCCVGGALLLQLGPPPPSWFATTSRAGRSSPASPANARPIILSKTGKDRQLN